jgi:hypothetical protein
MELARGRQDCCVVLRTEAAEQLDDAGTVKICHCYSPFALPKSKRDRAMLSLQAAPVEGSSERTVAAACRLSRQNPHIGGRHPTP